MVKQTHFCMAESKGHKLLIAEFYDLFTQLNIGAMLCRVTLLSHLPSSAVNLSRGLNA